MLPGFAVVFGQLFNQFSTLTGDSLKTAVSKIAIAFTGLGVGNFLFCYLGCTMWGIIGEDIQKNMGAILFEKMREKESPKANPPMCDFLLPCT